MAVIIPCIFETTSVVIGVKFGEDGLGLGRAWGSQHRALGLGEPGGLGAFIAGSLEKVGGLGA